MRQLLVIAAIIASAMTTPASAQSPGEKSGRYAMQPIEGGMLRLDTETGAMALCTKQGNQLSCEPVTVAEPDKEAERLARDNRDLRAEIKRLEDLLANPPQAPGGDDRQARRSPKFELPTEEDVDKALNYVERMFKKFRDKLKDLEGGRGTPL